MRLSSFRKKHMSMNGILEDYSQLAEIIILFSFFLGLISWFVIWKIKEKESFFQLFLISLVGLWIAYLTGIYIYNIDVIDLVLMKDTHRSSMYIPIFYMLIIGCGLKVLLGRKSFKKDDC